MKKLTQHQLNIAKWIESYCEKNDKSPTQTELAVAFKISQVTMRTVLLSIWRKGYVEWESGKNSHRSLRVIAKLPEVYGQ